MKNIFNKKRDIVIGAIHFPPLLGYPDSPGLDVALQYALTDLKAFEEGGADAVIIENNYDIPHVQVVPEPVVASLTYLTERILKEAHVPMGISVLWNDYKTALDIAKAFNLPFVRIHAFIDKLKTQYGTVVGDAVAITAYQTQIGAEHVSLFTDIHVKHSEILSPHSIEESARLAIQHGAKALIITGKWTGNAPDIKKLASVRDAVGDFPIFCGSGVNAANIRELHRYANGSIVSTSLKADTGSTHIANVKPYEARIEAEKVTQLISSLK